MATITNPNGAFGYGVNDGAKYPQTVDTFVTGGAVSRGQALRVEAALEATVGLVVVETSSAAGESFMGIALEDAADNSTVQVVTRGFAMALTSATSLTLGDAAHTAADGELAGTDVPLEDDVAYDIVGIWLGAEDAIETGFAPVWIS